MAARVLARAALAVTVTASLAALALLALGPGRPVRDDIFGGAGGLCFVLMGLAFAVVGAVVASGGHRIGAVLAGTGLLEVLGVLAWVYADRGVADDLPGTALAATFPSEPLAAVLGFAVLLFPDGRLPSRRWRPLAGLLGLGAVLLLVSDVLRPGRLDAPFRSLVSPLGVPGTRAAFDAVNTIGWLCVVPGVGLAAASLVGRLRRARGGERQQLEMVLAVGTVVVLITALDMLSWLFWPDGYLQSRIGLIGIAFALFPLAAGVAIQRHGLFDVAVVVNRALVYAALTATLAGAYVASVLVLQLVLSPSSDIAIAGSTLAVAALFRPARARIQALVDQRFFRRRYDAARTLEQFGARVRDQVDLAGLEADLRGAVAETVQPAHVSLWLRDP